MKHKVVQLPTHLSADKHGSLTVAELTKITDGGMVCAPRIYYIINSLPEKTTRGGHRHSEGGKAEFFVCIRGEVNVSLHSSDGCEDVTLNSPHMGLFLPPPIWHAVEMGPDSILLAIASTLYDPKESILERVCRCS